MTPTPRVTRAGLRRRLFVPLLSAVLAAFASSALAYLPPGASEAPSTAATNLPFPKRITARGPGFGSWTGALALPQAGRTGYYATAAVGGTAAGISPLMEFDNSGNATFRLSPLQPSVLLEPTTDASRMFAQQLRPEGTDVTFGIYSTTGSYGPVFQHRLTANADKTTIVRGASPARIYVTRDLNTEVEVLVFREDGTLEWGRRYASSSFGVNTGSPTDSQSSSASPISGGGLILSVAKSTINVTTGAMSNQTHLIRLSSTGEIVWAKRVVGEADFTVYADSPSQSIYLGGMEISVMGAVTGTVAKLTSGGALVWSRRLSGAFLSPVGELTNGRLLLSGSVMDMQFAPEASVLALLTSAGAVESQVGLSFAARNATLPVIEGNRIWITTVSSNVAGGSADGGPVHVGLADGDFSNLRWRRYANAMSSGLAMPDFDSDAVAASFFRISDGALEVMTFRDDFSSSVDGNLLPSVTATTTNPGITAVDAGYTMADITVTAAAVTPTLQTGALTFTVLPVTESAIGTGGGNGVPPTIGTQPASQKVNPGAAVSFSVAVNNPSGQTLSYQWSRNGTAISGANAATYSIPSAQAAQVGAYTVTVTAGTTTLQSSTALLELNATTRPVGDSVLFASNIQHPNGNVYDQFLLTGSATVITADPGQVARISFIDANDDIVQVEYSGAGTLTLQLANATGPAVAVNYNQATVSYMKGTPTITIAGADQTSNLGIFSVGSVTGNPAVLKSGVTYDGFANVALITISSANGQFGGVRIGNALLSGSSGNVGLVAPGVNFTGPIVIGDIDASGTASPKFLTGTVAGLAGFPGEIRIAGGDLLQTNGRAIEFGTATGVRMGAGTNAHGVSLPEKTVAGRLERNVQDVTSTVVVNPATSSGSVGRPTAMRITYPTMTYRDGSTVQAFFDYLQIVRPGGEEGRMYFPNPDLDNASDRPGRRNFESRYWDAYIAPEFDYAEIVERYRDPTGWVATIYEAEVTHRTTGRRSWLNLIETWENGRCTLFVALAPDRPTLHNRFKASDDFRSIGTANEFHAPPADLVGTWSSFEGAATTYYYAATGLFAGTVTAQTSSEFTFRPDGTYESTHSATSTFNTTPRQVTSNYQGRYTATPGSLTLTNREPNDPGEFHSHFEAVRGGYALRLVNKKFTGNNTLLVKTR